MPRSASTAIASNADRAAAYGMPGERVEDNDVEAVYDAAERAVARARAGRGPSLIEVHTLRLWGHFEGDAQGYRPELADVAEHATRSRATSRPCARPGVLDDAAVGPDQGRGAASGSRTRSPSPRTAPRPTRRRPPPTCSPEGDDDDHHRHPGRTRARQPPADHVQGDGRGHRAGDGTRPLGVLPGRGRRRLRRHLQLDHRPARAVRARSGSSTPRSPRPRSSASASAPRSRACGPSSS